MKLARLRLGWASRGIEKFQRDADAFLRLDPYEVIKQVNRIGQTRYQLRWFWKVHAEPSAELRFRAADAVHNLRATVENVLWGLGRISGTHKSLSLKFWEDPTRFTKWASYVKLERLPAEIVQWIKDEQLYNRPDGNRSMLHNLTKLWNEDKHCLPVLLGNAVGGMTVVSVPGLKHFDMSASKPKQINLNDGDEVQSAEVTCDDITQVNPEFSLSISFQAIEGIRAVDFLRRAEDHIGKDVFPKFEPFLA